MNVISWRYFIGRTNKSQWHTPDKTVLREFIQRRILKYAGMQNAHLAAYFSNISKAVGVHRTADIRVIAWMPLEHEIVYQVMNSIWNREVWQRLSRLLVLGFVVMDLNICGRMRLRSVTLTSDTQYGISLCIILHLTQHQVSEIKWKWRSEKEVQKCTKVQKSAKV